MYVCRFCGTAASGSTHWMCGGYLPPDESERPIAAATHIVRLLKRKPGVSHRGPWTADKLRARMRPELVPEFNRGLALAISAGKVRRRKGGELTLAPERVIRRQRTERDDGTAEGLFELP